MLFALASTHWQTHQQTQQQTHQQTHQPTHQSCQQPKRTEKASVGHEWRARNRERPLSIGLILLRPNRRKPLFLTQPIPGEYIENAENTENTENFPREGTQCVWNCWKLLSELATGNWLQLQRNADISRAIQLYLSRYFDICCWPTEPLFRHATPLIQDTEARH